MAPYFLSVTANIGSRMKCFSFASFSYSRSHAGAAGRVGLCVSVPLWLFLFFSAAGCGTRAPRAQTDLPPESASPEYWLSQPPVAQVSHGDFDQLWRACRRAVQSRSFTVDRVDLRGGRMATYPQISKQLFEFWRNDVGTLAGVLESTLGTVRRSVRMEVRRLPDDTYEAVPVVIVERFSQAERRVTSVARYAEVFAFDPAEQGSRARDRLGADLPVSYWYAAGRDRALERQIADDVRRDLRS